MPPDAYIRTWKLLLLAIRRVGTVLAKVVLILKVLGRRAAMWREELRVARYLGALLEHRGMVDGLVGILAPAKWPMVAHENRRHRNRVNVPLLKA